MQMAEVIRELMYVGRFDNQLQLAATLKCSQATVSRLKMNQQVASIKLMHRIFNLAKKHKIKVKLEDLFPAD